MKQVSAACLWPVSATRNGKILFNVSIENNFRKVYKESVVFNTCIFQVISQIV